MQTNPTLNQPTKVEVYIEYLDKETNDLVSEWDETYASPVKAQLATQESLHMYCHDNQVFKVYFVQGIRIVGVWHCQRMYNDTTLVVSWEVSSAMAPMGKQGILRQFEVVHPVDNEGWLYSEIPSPRKLSMLGISNYYTWGRKGHIEELSLEHPIAIEVA